MRFWAPVFVVVLLFIVFDAYFFWVALRRFPKARKTVGFKIFSVLYWLSTIAAIGFIFAIMPKVNSETLTRYWKLMEMWMGFMVVVYGSKSLYILFALLSDMLLIASLPFKKSTIKAQFVFHYIGMVAFTLFFLSAVRGIIFGRFDYKINNQTLYFEDLPNAFDGYRIVQFSDLHIGSFWGYPKKLQQALDLVDKQNGDIVVFTGDLVNNLAIEASRYESDLAKLDLNRPVYSILGNHDYAENVRFVAPANKKDAGDSIILFVKSIGYDLLLNENRIIKKGTDSIALIGVENWGEPPFSSHGDIEKALVGVETVPFKVLLSHNPSHWDKVIRDMDIPIQLTLSGHTHGVQFGVNWFGKLWSPIALRYPYWGGVYTEKNRVLAVSIGLGFIGFPGRIGMPPEINVYELRKK